MKNNRSERTYNRKPNFLCTRPKLTALLKAAGHEPEEVENPFDRSLSAWLFTIDSDLAIIVKRYYECEGRSIPKCIASFLQGEI